MGIKGLELVTDIKHQRSVCFQVICGLMVVKNWDENFGDRKSNFGGSCLEGLRIIFSDSQVILQDNIAIPIIPNRSRYREYPGGCQQNVF